MTEDRFLSLGRHLKNTFGERVHKISVYMGGQSSPEKTDPMRYCICNSSMRADAIDASYSLPVRDQIKEAKERTRKRFKSGKFSVYLHFIPGTVITLDAIEPVIDDVMHDNDVIGITVSLHDDLLVDDVSRYFRKVSGFVYLWVEVGAYTVHEETRKRLNISGGFDTVRAFIKRASLDGLLVAPHIVLGLPGETREMMHETMDEMARLNINGINIHHFRVLKETVMEKPLSANEITLLEREEYVQLVCDFIEKLPPDVVLHKIVGEAHKNRLIAPEWTLNKRNTIGMISQELEKRGSMQGCNAGGKMPSSLTDVGTFTA
ncbi:MAG: TIGR01212 family radical SAM protein [Nitrospinota bacterium]